MTVIPGIPKLPKLRKKRLILIISAIVIILILAAAVILHLLPDPGTLAHLTEPKIAAVPAVLLSSGADPLRTLMNKPLVADFSSAPEAQYSPLSIRFLDMSRGNPERWAWDFGDNASSTLQHPVHQYDRAGLYNVTLTVTRADGATRTVTQTDILGISQPPQQKVLVDTLRRAYITKGSEVTFLSEDANSSVVIDGAKYSLPSGSLVELRAGSDVGTDVSGKMNIRLGHLVSFAFPDVTLYVNGTQVAHGTSGDCFLPSYRYFRDNLTYSLIPTSGDIRQVVVDGVKVRAGLENSRILITHQAGQTTDDLTLVTFPAYFEGIATSLKITDAVIADFEPGTGISGPAPLNVTFSDASAGSPKTWRWDFGDGTVSDEKNPVHVYAVPGSYTVTLTVSRDDQRDTIVRKNAVIASPPRVVADFNASPLKGPAPLSVRFTDLSTNAPRVWVWTFGPDAAPMNSSEQSPVVSFPHPGTYTVSLTSGNVYGSSDIIRPQYITVTNPFYDPDSTLVVRTGKRGYIEKDSVVQFIISDLPASISINGGYRQLSKGSVVRLVAMSDQQGEIYIDKGEILKFSFPDMALYVDGNLVTEGKIDSIYIPYYSGFRTSLSYYLVPNSAYTYISVNGFDILGDLDNAWIRISSLGMDPGGNLRLITSDNETVIEGAANQTYTVHDWIVR